MGQILSNGTSLSFFYNYTLSGLYACFNLTQVEKDNWTLRYNYTTWDLVRSYYPFIEFEKVGLNLSLDTTRVCIEVVGEENVTYFKAGFVDNWENVTIEHTWPYEELGLMIFIAIMYFLMLLWVTYSLIFRILHDHWFFPGKVLTHYTKAALMMLCLQCTLRVIYFVGLPFGVWEFDNLSILFSDLPQLLFHATVVLTGVMWEDIVNQVQHTRYLTATLSYIFIISLFTFFVALMIAYGSLSSQALSEFSCGTTEEEKTVISPAEGVGYAYRAIFALYSVFIASSFATQAVRIVALFDEIYKNHTKEEPSGKVKSATGEYISQQSVASNMKQLRIVFGITSILSICGLLIQAAIAIYSAISTMENTTKLALIITCELLPTYGLAYLFRYGSPWTAFKLFSSSGQSKQKSGSVSTTTNTPSPARKTPNSANAAE